VAAVPAEIQGPSDAELIESVRAGQLDAYGSLYERHVTAAYNLARQLARSTAEADDLVSEAFARVLDSLRAGRGPDSAFRAYLLTALRHVAYDKTRRDRKVELTDDVTTVSGVSTERISEPFRDTAVAGLERSLAAKAFARLPERWQAVLWHTEIEGQSPAEVAPLLGLTANGVSALAYRAREGLRQAYLQVHLAETTAGRCRATAEKLGAWTRGGLSKRETAQVEAHLDECDRCTALAAELADVNGGLRAVAILVLGVGTAGYLAATATKAGAGIAATAAATAGTTSAASGAANVAASVPRQFIGVGASVAALAAVLALALSGSGTQNVPTAVATPQHPSVTQPVVRPPTSKPAVPAPPNNPSATTTPPTTPPSTPPSTPTSAPNSPPASTTTPTTVPTSPSSPAPPPGQPTLTASGPSGGVTLTPGQAALDLPIKVTNTGSVPSDPVTAVLTLPSGVTAQSVRPASTLGGHSLDSHPIGSSFQEAGGQAAGSTTTVSCPPGSGTVTCTSPSGLQPGNSVELVFRLVAAAGAQDGDITGTVTAGSAVAVHFTVHVTVAPPPLVDGLRLTATIDTSDSWWMWLWDESPILDVTATNTGTSTKPVTVTVDESGSLWSSHRNWSCQGGQRAVTCTSNAPLPPNHALDLRIRLYDLDADDSTIDVTGQLGTATATTTVHFRAPRCDWLWCWPVQPGPPPDGPVPPTPTGTTTAPPATTAPSQEPTTTPPGTTTRPHQPVSPAPPPPTVTTPPAGPNPTEPGAPPSINPPTPTTNPPTCPSSPPQSGKARPGAPTDCQPLLPTLLSLLGPL
jgi:RNA polymerase sigma factor (sigma-70 family)